MNALLLAAAALSASDLLEKSIRHHDPHGRLDVTAIRIELSETRPNGPDRKTVVVIDTARSRFEMERESDDGKKVNIVTDGDDAKVLLDGSPNFTKEESERYRLSPEQALRTRDYYIYLYGLPMKLRDPGTRLDPEAREAEFMGKPVYELRVTYDEDVGSDTWYFYLDRKTYALVGYRFYHDESKNDGEYIVLEGEAEGAGLRLPRARTWYRHQDEAVLGTDTIESVRPR